jgi:hypothetical protein
MMQHAGYTCALGKRSSLGYYGLAEELLLRLCPTALQQPGCILRTCIILTAHTVSTSCTEKMTVSPFSVLSAISCSTASHTEPHCSGVPGKIMLEQLPAWLT